MLLYLENSINLLLPVEVRGIVLFFIKFIFLLSNFVLWCGHLHFPWFNLHVMFLDFQDFIKFPLKGNIRSIFMFVFNFSLQLLNFIIWVGVFYLLNFLVMSLSLGYLLKLLEFSKFGSFVHFILIFILLFLKFFGSLLRDVLFGSRLCVFVVLLSLHNLFLSLLLSKLLCFLLFLH